MILHTIADPYMIFPGKETPVKYYKLKHGYAECTVSEGKISLRSLHSTNPSDYLSGECGITELLPKQ